AGTLTWRRYGPTPPLVVICPSSSIRRPACRPPRNISPGATPPSFLVSPPVAMPTAPDRGQAASDSDEAAAEAGLFRQVGLIVHALAGSGVGKALIGL